MRKLARWNGLILFDDYHGLYHSMSCIDDGKASICPCYEFDAGKCGLFKLKKDGYYDVFMWNYEAMQCLVHWLLPIVYGA